MYSYFYSNAILPKDKRLLELINLAAGNLDRKLQELRLCEIGISAYNQKYLGNYLQNIRGSLQVSSYILAWALSFREVSFKKLVFVDYGGGCGILSLLAKEIGIGNVIYNDIYDVSCKDSRAIAKELKLEANKYICGDIDDLINYLNKSSISVNVIASYDVIEHIYDIEYYFKQLSLMPSKSLCFVFASSANIHNPMIKRHRMKLQRREEYCDRELEWGYKERDSARSYLKIRKEIIALFEPSLSLEEVTNLAYKTRGLIKKDIERCVIEYKTTGTIAYKINNSTDTCDPLTGNWKEHLMTKHYLKQITRREGFAVEIKNGYYCSLRHPLKQLVVSFLNKAISFLGHRGLLIAPYYVVYSEVEKTGVEKTCFRE